MIACIQLTKLSIFTILIICLLLCIRIPSSISIDPIDEVPTVIISENEDNHSNSTNDQSSTQVNDDVLSDAENLPNVEDNVGSEIQSEITTEVTPTTSSSLITELPTTEESSSTTPSVPTKINRSHINSFEEWKQQQLLAEPSKKNENANSNSLSSEIPLLNAYKGTSPPPNSQQMPSSKKGKLRKNFASASCGAKILAHNTEAQNVGSILSSSPDEYMLNPCNAKIWFVIELCESIRILNIEIANFELFSSVPKTFRVSASDRYPTKDWHRHHLGTFNASFNRTIQSFHAAESTTYLKYIKFELLDFHGHEHYCPLSVVRIHGSNVEDEIMTMEENTNVNDLKTSSDIRNENENEDDDDDDDLTNDQQVGGIIGSAILDLAKRVFRRQTIRGTQSTTTLPILQTDALKSECHSNVLNGSLSNESIHSWRQTDQFKQCIADYLFGLWSTFNTCTIYLSQMCLKFNYCCQCPVVQTNSILSSQSSMNFYIHPCGYYHILTSPFICQKEKLIGLNQTKIVDNMTQDFLEKNSSINETLVTIDENKKTSDFIPMTDQSLLNLTNNFSNETDDQSLTTRSNEQISLTDISNETISVPESTVSIDTTNETSSQPSNTETVSENINTVEPLTDTIQSIDETNTVTTTATPSTLNHEVIPPLISSPWLKGMLVNTKSLPELFKIIEKLNFNLTLSNRYLQELSQHYVKKLDETQQTTDLLLKSSKAADEKLANLEEHFYEFEDKFTDMSYRLIKLEAWIPLIVCVIICLFIWCISTTCRLIHLKRKLRTLRNEFEEFKKIKQIEKDDVDDEDDPPAVYTNGGSKRRSSTDSNDSNPTRSQRVPDGHLTKIIENGYDQIQHKLNGKSSINNQKKN